MPTCHVLAEVGKNGEERLPRLNNIVSVLLKLGFTVQPYGRELIDPVIADNLESQTGSKDGQRSAYGEVVSRDIYDRVQKGDLVIATEAWHWRCFGGTLNLCDWKLKCAPVVEMWIDYSLSFAKYRIFSSRFAMYMAAAREGFDDWRFDWITAKPYVKAELNKASSLMVKELEIDPYSTECIDYMAKGVPVLAPDWGIWAEAIVHGATGALYRTVAGKDKSREIALGLKGKDIVKAISWEFGLEMATKQVEKYLMGLSKNG